MLALSKVDRQGRKIYKNDRAEHFVLSQDPLTGEHELVSTMGAKKFNRSVSSTYPLHKDLEILAIEEFSSDIPFIALPKEEQLRKAALLLQAIHIRAGKFMQTYK